MRPRGFSYRSRMDIIASILASAEREISKTKLMYSANLSFEPFQSYLAFLLERELLEMKERQGQTLVKTTSKGTDFLRLYRTIEDMMNK